MSKRFKGLAGYELSHIAYHLQAAGLAASLHQLLSLEDKAGRNEWYSVKDSNNQLQSYLDDLELGRQMAEKSNEPGDVKPDLASQIRYAFMFSSVKAVAAQFPTELLGQAVEIGALSLTKAIDLARQTPDRDRVPEALMQLAAYLPSPQKENLSQEALEVCRSIQIPVSQRHFEDRGPDDPRRDILIRLFPLIPRTQISAAFAIVWSMPKLDRTLAIKEIKDLLGRPELDTIAVWVGDNIKDEYAADLAAYLAPAIKHEGLYQHLSAIAHQMIYSDPESRFIVRYRLYSDRLRNILGSLTKESRRKICEDFIDVDLVEYVYREEKADRKVSEKLHLSRRQIQSKVSFEIRETLEVMATFVRDLSSEHRKTLLERLRVEKDRSGYAIALTNLLPELDKKHQAIQVAKLARMVKRIDHSSELANALVRIGPTLDSNVVIGLATAAKAWGDLSFASAEILLNYAHQAPEGERGHIYSLAYKNLRRTRGLAGWASTVVEWAHQFPRRYHNKLTAMLPGTSDRDKLEMLNKKSAPFLRSSRFSGLLRYARAIDSPTERSQALSRLATIAPRRRKKSVIQIAVATVQRIGDEQLRDAAKKRLNKLLRKQRIKQVANLFYDQCQDYHFGSFPSDRAQFVRALPKSMREAFVSALFRKASSKNFENLEFVTGIFPLLGPADRKQITRHVLRYPFRSKKQLRNARADLGRLVQLFEPSRKGKYARRLTKRATKWIDTIAGLEILSVSLPLLEKTAAAGLATAIYGRARKLRQGKGVSTKDSKTLILARTIPWLPQRIRSRRLSKILKELIDESVFEDDPLKALLEGATLNFPPYVRRNVASRVLRGIQQYPGSLADLTESLLPLLPPATAERLLGNVYSFLRPYSGGEEWEDRRMRLCIILADFGLIEQALDLAKTIDREHIRSSMLARLVPYLPLERRYEILRQALSYLDAVEPDSRTDALSDISLSAELLPEEMQFQLVSLLLRTLANRPRFEIVEEILPILPVTRSLAGDEIISDVGKALSQVGRWWR